VIGGLGPHAYTTAKHGLIGLTRSAASELAAHGVRVNAVAPGTTVTNMIVQGRGSLEAALDAAARSSPLGTPLMPEKLPRPWSTWPATTRATSPRTLWWWMPG
jgi:NAD(P)-dependent dehydrogenase (short-subunit alcohol dehydrogenase family)